MLPPMRHLAFFEVIAEHPDQGDPLWVESVSGMLVLRFFEEWLDSPALASMNESGIERMRGMIDEVKNPEIRALLGTAVTVLMEAEGGDPVLVVGPLLAYARALEEAEQYTLAVDVLETVIEPLEHSKGPHALQLTSVTYRRLGTVLLRMERFDDAEERFRRAISYAEAVHDVSLTLEARISQTRVWIARGNLGDVEAALTLVIDQAQAVNLQRIDALARRVRGTALQKQGRHDQALREFHRAYAYAPDELEREFLLGDMAACAAELGLRSTARILHQTLARTALNKVARSIARVNLLEIAVWDGDQTVFHTLWNALQQEQVPNDIGMYACLYHAQGIERWETTDAAISAYRLVAEQAARAGTHQVEFLALEAVERLQSRTANQKVSTPISLGFEDAAKLGWQDVTQAIEEICSLRLDALNAAD